MKRIRNLLTLSAMLAAAPLASWMNPDARAAAAPFADIEAASPWARDVIVKVQQLGLMGGDQEGHFRPQETITRQEVAAILVNLLHLQTPEISRSSFTDVTSADWGMKQIEAVAKAGLMNGANGRFRPHDPVTREEMAVILVHAAKGSAEGDGEALPLADREAISPWARGYVQAALKMGLMSGDGDSFHPQTEAKRQEVAAMLLNFVQVAQKTNEAAALQAINQAADGKGMHDALEGNAGALRLDVSAGGTYGSLSDEDKQTVAEDVYANRPADGFSAASDVKTLFDQAVTTRAVMRQALDRVNHAASPADVLAQDGRYLTDVISALEQAGNTPGFTVEAGEPIKDTLARYQTLASAYDGLTGAQKQLVSAAIQGRSFTSYSALVQSLSTAVKQAALLVDINAAPEFNTMKSLLEKNADVIGIDVSSGSDYAKLLDDPANHQPNYDNQLHVAKDVLDNKPAGGYTRLADVQAVFQQSVKVRTLFQQELARIQTATPAALAGAPYITEAIGALEDALGTPSVTLFSGQKIEDLLLRMKQDMIAYNALPQDGQLAVDQAVAGHAFRTYDELLQAFEQALKAKGADLAGTAE
jgi:hypothetical protein